MRVSWEDSIFHSQQRLSPVTGHVDHISPRQVATLSSVSTIRYHASLWITRFRMYKQSLKRPRESLNLRRNLKIQMLCNGVKF